MSTFFSLAPKTAEKQAVFSPKSKPSFLNSSRNENRSHGKSKLETQQLPLFAPIEPQLTIQRVPESQSFDDDRTFICIDDRPVIFQLARSEAKSAFGRIGRRRTIAAVWDAIKSTIDGGCN